MPCNIDPFLKPADTFIRNNPSEKEKVQKLLDIISAKPFVDKETKFYFLAPPVMLTICRAEGLWLIYYLDKESNSIKVCNIGFAKEKTSIR